MTTLTDIPVSLFLEFGQVLRTLITPNSHDNIFSTLCGLVLALRITRTYLIHRRSVTGGSPSETSTMS